MIPPRSSRREDALIFTHHAPVGPKSDEGRSLTAGNQSLLTSSAATKIGEIPMLWFQLRNELWKLFGKQRTYIGSSMFFLAQSIGILIFQFGQGPYRQLVADIERLGVSPEHFVSNLTVA